MPDMKVIGVTGSYGKTSLKFYLQTLLQTKYNVLVTPASYNTPMGIVMTVRGHMKPSHEIFVCEMGARYEGEIKEVCDIASPDHGVITSIGPQHLDTFHDMETIVRTKFELADALPEGGMLFLNGDNVYIQSNADKYENVTFYRSETDGQGYRAGDLSLSQSGTRFTVTAPSGESEVFQTKLIGAHNVINITGAIAVAHKLGIPLAELRVPVRRIRPVAHRMEMKERDGVTIIDDAYNSNPVGSKAAVETLKLLSGVRILITPGMVELGEDEDEYNYKFGTYAAACCDYVVLIGRRHTEPIAKGLADSDFPSEKVRVYENLEDAMSFARSIRDEGHKYILLENDLPDIY
jgi:UDP-N-acetylmuramoyl-tripeptide--D-alanyl-D-alanine ligase